MKATKVYYNFHKSKNKKNPDEEFIKDCVTQRLLNKP